MKIIPAVAILAVFATAWLMAAPAARPVAPAAAPDGMVLVKEGSFQMGNVLAETSGGDDEKPLHKVTLADFWMAKHEVTWALWKKVYDWAVANGYEFENAGAMGYKAEQGGNDVDEDAPGGAAPEDSHPVTTVSWYDVVKWCNAYSEMEKRTPVYYTGSAFRTV